MHQTAMGSHEGTAKLSHQMKRNASFRTHLKQALYGQTLIHRKKQ